MTVVLGHRPSIRKKYAVRCAVNGRCPFRAYADTLLEAKRVGRELAGQMVWRGKWAVAFVTIPILEADAPGSTR